MTPDREVDGNARGVAGGARTASRGRRETFFALTPERVLAAVETCGRRATGYALALNSLENRVYEVELESGERVVAKFYRPERWSREAILDEHAFLLELAAEELPVAAPLPLEEPRQHDAPVTLGALAAAAHDEHGTAGAGAIHYAVFPKVRGRTPGGACDLATDELERIGRLIARVHHVGARRPALHRPRLDSARSGQGNVAAIGQLRLFGDPGDPLRARHESVARDLLAVVDDAFARAEGRGALEGLRIHADCHLGNLLWGEGGPLLVDFDDFVNGPPAQDLWLVSPGFDDEALAAREALVRGYESMRAFDRRSLALVEPLRALRILRYAAWIAERWDDPAFPRAFPDFGSDGWLRRELRALEEQLERCARVAREARA